MCAVKDTEEKPQVAPEFVVTLKQMGNDGGGIVEIRGRRSYESRDDIPRWLHACLRDLVSEFQQMKHTPRV